MGLRALCLCCVCPWALLWYPIWEQPHLCCLQWELGGRAIPSWFPERLRRRVGPRPGQVPESTARGVFPCLPEHMTQVTQRLNPGSGAPWSSAA